jgi:hypothetical protein
VYQSRTPGSSAYAPATAALALDAARHDPMHHHTAPISERRTRRIDVTETDVLCAAHDDEVLLAKKSRSD